MGGGGPGKTGQEADKATADIAFDLLEKTRGLRVTSFQQLFEALSTGKIGAREQEVRDAVGASKVQASQDNQIVRDSLAAKNLAATPFGQAKIAEVGQEGATRTALVPSDIINALIQGQAPGTTGQAVETSLSGLGSLADSASRNSLSKRLAGSDTLAAVITGVGQLGASGVQAYSAQPSYSPTPAPTTPPPTYWG